MTRRRKEQTGITLSKLRDISPRAVKEEKPSRPSAKRRPAMPQPRSPIIHCRCGSGRAPTMCYACTIRLDLSSLERRMHDGREQVRISGNITWGRVPEGVPGPVYVSPDVASEWIDADSEEGRRLVAAVHPLRALFSGGA